MKRTVLTTLLVVVLLLGVSLPSYIMQAQDQNPVCANGVQVRLMAGTYLYGESNLATVRWTVSGDGNVTVVQCEGGAAAFNSGSALYWFNFKEATVPQISLEATQRSQDAVLYQICADWQNGRGVQSDPSTQLLEDYLKKSFGNQIESIQHIKFQVGANGVLTAGMMLSYSQSFRKVAQFGDVYSLHAKWSQAAAKSFSAFIGNPSPNWNDVRYFGILGVIRSKQTWNMLDEVAMKEFPNDEFIFMVVLWKHSVTMDWIQANVVPAWAEYRDKLCREKSATRVPDFTMTPAPSEATPMPGG